MSISTKSRSAFTFVELLVVITVVGVLAALLLPVMSQSKASAKSTVCQSNLKQINLGMRLYWDDNSSFPPGVTNTTGAPFGYWTGYKELLKSYVGFEGCIFGVG